MSSLCTDNRSKCTSSQSDSNNLLLEKQRKFLSSLPESVKQNFFSNEHVSAETRAQIWSDQAELGEGLVNKYSWATPDERALNIIKYFASKCDGIVEIGCGSNAYWTNLMINLGVSVLAFDIQLLQGGKIHHKIKDDDNNDVGFEANDNSDSNGKKRKHSSIQMNGSSVQIESKRFDNGLVIYKGGPEVLSQNSKFKDIHNRVLFLCYPDEDVFEDEHNQYDNEDDDYEANSTSISSMGAACLEHYMGDTIIHVGELFGDTLSMDHAPWGRSSSAEFQQRLFSEYHCILRAKLTNWLHVRDTISVWKRSQCCSIVFQAEDEGDENEESEYKYIPENEVIQTDVAAPCAQHLL